MNQPFALAAPLLPACATMQTGPQTGDTPVWVSSHNRSDVDVYLLCGDQDATWLGLVPSRSGAAYSIPAAQRRCPVGLNFFLVVKDQGRGYWAGPIRPEASSQVVLVIEKYAGLSAARLTSMR
jgi:hypothetical protein